MVTEIYTAITGNKEPHRGDLICFIDYHQFTREVMNAKIFKILSHQFVNGDISIWVDGNIKLLIDKDEFIKEFLGDADIAIWKHFGRDCLYEESKAALGRGTDYSDKITAQAEAYRQRGFPEHAGLAECNVIVRRNTKRVNEFNNAWWAEICRWSCRDQIAFPYVIKDFPDLKVKYNEGNVREHEWFEYTPH